MAIIDSRPPEIIDFVDIDTKRPPFSSIRGEAFSHFVLAGSVVTPSATELVEAVRPFWEATDRDFRTTRSLHADTPVRHSMRVERTTISPAYPALVFGPKEYRGAGDTHIDWLAGDPKVQRYVYHPNDDTTEFYLGHRWLALDPTRFIKSLANIPLLRMQRRGAMAYQPPAGSVVRLDGQVHRRPRRKLDSIFMNDTVWLED